MQLYKFDGEVFFCDMSAKRMQVFVEDLETGKKYKPVITSKNKKFNYFYNRRTTSKKPSNGFYFTAKMQYGYGVESLRNVVIYSDEYFIDKFAELLI